MPINNLITYDCAIIGGGLAGLCLSIQLAEKGQQVILLEKNRYPFHKVCGEYISMESWHFLESLGLPLSQIKPPEISTLCVTAQNGYKITSALGMGGFGMSRYMLDEALARLARQKGVVLIENCRVTQVKQSGAGYEVETSEGPVLAKLVCGSFGKINPPFIDKPKKKTKANYIGVKYHIKTRFSSNLIELHNFKDGYCGISMVDDETCCLCYLTTSKNLNDNNNDIKLLEKNVLMQNPYLKKYFTESEFLFEKPLTISGVGFHKKSLFQNHVIMLGDAAGAIAPLCGNGMSMAMRSSKILAGLISQHIQNTITKDQLIELYAKAWDSQFSARIKTGYYLQQLFGKKNSTLITLKLLNAFPRLFRYIISLTHGNKF